MSHKTFITLALGTALALALGASTVKTADAGTRSYSHIQSASAGTVNIQSPGQSAQSRSIVLPYSKSTVVVISQHAPDATVEIQAVNNNILLTGAVQNASMANRVEKLAMMWLDETTAGGGEGEIVNLMSVEGKDQVLLKVRIVEMLISPIQAAVTCHRLAQACKRWSVSALLEHSQSQL